MSMGRWETRLVRLVRYIDLSPHARTGTELPLPPRPLVATSFLFRTLALGQLRVSRGLFFSHCWQNPKVAQCASAFVTGTMVRV